MTSSGGGFFGNDIVETEDEEGNKHYFEKIDEFEVDGQDYVLLIYQGEADKDEEGAEGYDEEVVVMRLHKEETGDTYEQIEDEAEFDKVVKFLEEYEEEEVVIDINDILDNLGGSPN